MFAQGAARDIAKWPLVTDEIQSARAATATSSTIHSAGFWASSGSSHHS